MLERIALRHFKCFEDLILPLAPLTLLSGPNASGKSTVIQALALLHQTMHEHEWSTRLILNGRSLHAGTVTDVVDKVHGRRGFDLVLVDGGSRYEWVFVGDRDDLSLEVAKVVVPGPPDALNRVYERPKALQHLFPFTGEGTHPAIADRLRRLTYLTAERVGPREYYSLEDGNVGQVVGRSGEYAASVLHCGRGKAVLPSLVIEASTNTRLHQVEARMRRFFPGCSFIIEPVARQNAVTLAIRTSDETDYHRPVHVGFGLTQVFPIVVAALSAEPGDILMIENPEVHLHPAGQALMGAFLAEVADAGVQVIIETHSDHVLNGIRRAVKSGMSPDRVALHFFRPRGDDGEQVTSPQMDASGNIDVWPDGFFDQFDKDMNHFAGWGE